MATYYGTTSSCGSTGTTLNVPGSGCVALSGNLSTYFAATPPPATVSCSWAVNTDPTKVTATAERYCDVPTACQEDVCNGVVPAGFSACIYVSGTDTCPSGWNAETTVGDATTLSCSTCGCNASASCTGGDVQFYSDNACSTALVSLAVNGSCVTTSGGGQVKSYKYSATVTNAQCTATGSDTATTGLTAQHTICCK
jgi:hypothetical protein